MNPWRWLSEPICDWPKLDHDSLGAPYVIGERDNEPRKVTPASHVGSFDAPDLFWRHT